MAYFWVNQKQTWRHESQGGYIWAPKSDKEGRSNFHWDTMQEVQPGDLIFSYVKGAIVATSVAKTTAYDSPKPAGFRDWETEGRRVDVEYGGLPNPLRLEAFESDFKTLLPDKYSPLKGQGKGANQGYLFRIPPRAGRLLLDRIGIPEQAAGDELDAAVSRATPTATERTSLMKSRVGQGTYRDELLRLWGGACAVTGLDVVTLLRASHIKPWRDSNNVERLDAYNGLPLAPGYDAAFDSGLITFDATGAIVISKHLPPRHLPHLGISPNAKIERLGPRQLAYLEYHRAEVFENG